MSKPKVLTARWNSSVHGGWVPDGTPITILPHVFDAVGPFEPEYVVFLKQMEKTLGEGGWPVDADMCRQIAQAISQVLGGNDGTE